jgi:hypothetical protein
MTLACSGCVADHKKEQARLVQVGLLCRELVGRDCGEIIAGYLPYFFAAKKNESPAMET